jgi:transcriptional regulator with XRE-family HTH domain
VIKISREYIALTLKRLREKSGLTTSQVGELLGKSGKTVNAWEHNHGQPDAEMLMKLCDIYNVKDILAEFRENKREDITNLSDEEIYLIKSYRNLSEQGQEYILQTIDIVKDKYKKDLYSSDSQKIG